MSNLLNQKLRGKTIKIFGPPGTGKTENLLKRVKRYLEKGYSPDEICYVSFTNKAVNECISRVRNKFKNYDEDAFKYFRTLHSLARQQFAEIPVLDPKADLLMFHTQYGTIKIGYKDTWDDQKVYNNWSLQIYDRARNMKVDPVALYKQQSRKNVRLQQFKSIIAGYEEFKSMETPTGQRTPDRLDFTDMVERYITDGLVIPFKVLMVDEAQDCSRPQIKALHKLATNIKDPEGYRFIGDADQTLYQYAGADPEYFHMLALKHKDNELKDGLRCCETINTICKNIIAPVWKKWGYTRKWLPAGGKIGEHNFISRIDKPCPGSFKLLQKIKSTLETFLFVYRGVPSDDVIKTFFYKHGIDFSHVGSDPHISRKVFRCFNTWDKFLTDKVSLQQIKEYWPLMGVRGENGVKVNKTMVKGLDTIRSNFPNAMRSLMKEVLEDILMSVPKDKIDDRILTFKRLASILSAIFSSAISSVMYNTFFPWSSTLLAT